MSYEDEGLENPEELLDEVEEIEELSEAEKFRQEFLREHGEELPDLPGIESIVRIEDPERRDKRIEEAKMLKEEERKLGEEYESGRIDQATYEGKLFGKYLHKEAQFEAKCDLESVGITYGKLNQLSGQYQAITTGDPDRIDLNDRLDKFVENNPEHAQEEADKMFEEGRLSKKNYDTISEKVGYFK